jgi:hypothetical protein
VAPTSAATIVTTGLFSADPGTNTTSGQGVIRRRDAEVDIAQLELGSLQPARRDAEFFADFERVESTAIGSAWVGTISDMPGSLVTLAVSVDGVFSATVEFPGTLYSVVRATTGRYVIAQVDLTSIPRPG